ncbi:YqkE family protein [Paenibacillus sp. ACRRX]|uniref:YqkE family protein n=1 Tax=Paenibacillus sp. ACRRX TaxID=2918206 RepID=UPI001EF4E52F|nr:YqkE family protein [Paenibacillus sp. ACRRX]MCG7406180.1 YqkE family protein [Paenibacillus sp. ACRRX]
MAKAKSKRPAPYAKPVSEEKPATLKDLLSPEVLNKLKAQSEELKATEVKQKEDERKRLEEARKAEQKQLDNNFEYLLNNSSMDWRKHK